MAAFDVMVIGGGTGGLRMAHTCASAGLNTVLIEPGVLGGTCLNNGCIPTKAMLHAAHMYESAKEMKKFGVSVSNVKINFSQLMKRVLGIVNTGQQHIKQSIKRKNLTLIKGSASFVNKNSVKVGKKKVTAKHIVVATGSSNFVPPIKGLDKVPFLDNMKVLELKKLPKSLIMIGGGFISMEYAAFFQTLGCKVTVVEFSPQVLAMLDDDIRQVLVDTYTKKGMKMNTNHITHEVYKKAGKVHAIISSKDSGKKKTLSADALFVATGRIPNTKYLNTDAAGIKLGKRHEIVVNSKCQTTNPHIYALGDVNGAAMFAHAAKRETKIILANIQGKRASINFKMVPWAVFTTPPIGGIGLNEKQAKQQGISYATLTAPFTRAGRATIIDDTRGFVKVLYEKKSKKIIGTTIVGPNADDLIHEFVAVMNSDSPTINTIRKTIHVHPTISEVMEELY